MPLTYPALKQELQADPRAYGYAAVIATGVYANVAALLNAVRDGTTAAPNGVVGAAISVNRGTISAQELVEAIVQSEMPTNASQRDWLIMVASGARVRVDTASTARAGLLAIFAAGTATRTNLTTVSSRPGSRAEELFGLGVAITGDDVGQALNATP